MTSSRSAEVSPAYERRNFFMQADKYVVSTELQVIYNDGCNGWFDDQKFVFVQQMIADILFKKICEKSKSKDDDMQLKEGDGFLSVLKFINHGSKDQILLSRKQLESCDLKFLNKKKSGGSHVSFILFPEKLIVTLAMKEQAEDLHNVSTQNGDMLESSSSEYFKQLKSITNSQKKKKESIKKWLLKENSGNNIKKYLQKDSDTESFAHKIDVFRRDEPKKVTYSGTNDVGMENSTPDSSNLLGCKPSVDGNEPRSKRTKHVKEGAKTFPLRSKNKKITPEKENVEITPEQESIKGDFEVSSKNLKTKSKSKRSSPVNKKTRKTKRRALLHDTSILELAEEGLSENKVKSNDQQQKNNLYSEEGEELTGETGEEEGEELTGETDSSKKIQEENVISRTIPTKESDVEMDDVEKDDSDNLEKNPNIRRNKLKGSSASDSDDFSKSSLKRTKRKKRSTITMPKTKRKKEVTGKNDLTAKDNLLETQGISHNHSHSVENDAPTMMKSTEKSSAISMETLLRSKQTDQSNKVRLEDIQTLDTDELLDQDSTALNNTIDLEEYGNVSFEGVKHVREFTVEQIRDIVRSVEDDLRKIFKGKTQCARHDQFKNGGRDRGCLNMQVSFGLFSQEQEDMVCSTLMQMFCANRTKYFDYVMKVLLPETMAMIYAKVAGISKEEADAKMMAL